MTCFLRFFPSEHANLLSYFHELNPLVQIFKHHLGRGAESLPLSTVHFVSQCSLHNASIEPVALPAMLGQRTMHPQVLLLRSNGSKGQHHMVPANYARHKQLVVKLSSLRAGSRRSAPASLIARPGRRSTVICQSIFEVTSNILCWLNNTVAFKSL